MQHEEYLCLALMGCSLETSIAGAGISKVLRSIYTEERAPVGFGAEITDSRSDHMLCSEMSRSYLVGRSSRRQSEEYAVIMF